jgi:hypothetical protein
MEDLKRWKVPVDLDVDGHACTWKSFDGVYYALSTYWSMIRWFEYAPVDLEGHGTQGSLVLHFLCFRLQFVSAYNLHRSFCPAVCISALFQASDYSLVPSLCL